MNPYKILNIDGGIEKRDIVQAAALALRERHYSAKEVAMAQRELLDPASSAAHRFLHFVDLDPFLKAVTFERSEAPRLSGLKRLEVFDEDS
ncbi:conserved hypothetical protein [delta proteobacterium NaphS2]|nr:conserved hypothetical protein [delta proteobacterium NaphS2]